ncbi:MAG: metal-dependent hydrolase [Moraxellaceae bacterium]|jgi:predicted metal-dependent hydrolase|nr:metal-dependent hydrolase [Moraxellaceae bacterium]MBP8851919.1 metal-dependent hydrolase [Moraxellaceae bacterium]MBP9731287.1 metal-dependent hydrolase [Moraxellaceae bacterium]
MTAQAKIKASFPVRRMDFGFKDVPKYWFANDPFLTHFLTSLSSLFPEGEFFFVTSMRNIRDQIDDPVMQKEISAFIGQEAMHSKEHKAFNDYATAHGIDVDYMHRRVGKLLKFGHKILSHKQQLAITCGLEHFTATIANQLMRREDINGLMIDPMMRKMWLWHAVEESEHKSVCYDAYQHLYKNGYGTRATFMALAWSILALVLVEQQVRLMAKDKQLLNISSWRRGMWTLFGYKGFLSELALPLLDYFRPGFHPEDHFSDDMEAKYKALLKFDN